MSMLASARSRIDNLKGHCAIDDEALERLSHPHRTIAASIPLRRDNGKLEMLKAWRCQYSDLRGPTKGGIRFHPSVSMDEVMTLAFWMSLKTAVVDLPYGGAKGGVCVDATKLSKMELERLSRSYVDAFADVIGPDRDIPAPDMYTNAMVMAWMTDQYSRIAGRHSPAAFTGKPVSTGGSQGRDSATAQGAYHVFEALRDQLNVGEDSVSFAVQGFGNAGRKFCQLAVNGGHKIIAASDSSGSVTDADGLDVEELVRAKDDEGSVCAYSKGGTHSENSNHVLLAEADILVPAALGDVINQEIASELNCRAILEIANGPVNPDADETLRDEGVEVIPDILANSGGVIVSYFEWVQNKSGDYWSAESVQNRRKERIKSASGAIRKIAEDEGLSLRQAAYLSALNRLSEAAEARGTRSTFQR